VTLAAVIHDVITDLGPKRPSVDDLVDQVLLRAPDLVEQEAARLLRGSLARRVKDCLRSAFDTDEDYAPAQLGLPGFEHVPAHLTVRGLGRIYVVPIRMAVYGELGSAIEERRQHRQRVDVVLGELQTLQALVAPAMADQPTEVTVADALSALVKSA